jgi:tetratricopeptide (TPR) repeat protein
MRFDDLDGAEVFLNDALEEAANPRSRGRALEGQGQLAYRRGNPRKAADLLEQALEAYGSDVVDHPKLADTLGRVYAMLGDLNGSIQVFDRCLADAQRRNDQIEASRFGVLLGNALIDAADFDRAATLVAQTLDIVEELSDPILLARLYWTQSRLHGEQDDSERAARYARKALAIIEMTEDRAYAARAHQLLAHIELDNDRPEEALAILEQGQALTGDLSPLERAQYRLEEARALAGMGQTEEAASLAMEVAGVIAGSNVEDAGRSYTLLADLFAQIGDPERAAELYELAAELLEKNPNRYLVRAYRRHAELLEDLGRTGDAMELLKKAVAIGEYEQPKLRLPRLSVAAIPSRPSY